MAKRKTKEEKEYWRGIWEKAINNMPYRISITRHTYRVPLAPNVPVGLFIALQSKGNLAGSDDQYYRLIREHTRYVGGQKNLFMLLIGLPTHYRWSAARVHNWAKNGVKPKHPAQRKRLLDLAENGRQIAWDYLKLVGTDHLYSDEVGYEGPLFTELNPKNTRRKQQ